MVRYEFSAINMCFTVDVCGCQFYYELFMIFFFQHVSFFFLKVISGHYC